MASKLKDTYVNKHEITSIRDWLNNQPFLPHNLSDEVIITFLLGCGNNIKFTKKVLTNYYYCRQATPELFSNRDPLLRENLNAWGASNFIPLQRDERGCMVFFGIPLRSKTFVFTQLAKQVFMCFDLLIAQNEWGNGDRIYVLSYKHVEPRNFATYTSYITRSVAEFERENFLPGQLLAVHNIFVPEFMEKIHKSFAPYLSSQHKKQVFFHKDVDSLFKFVSPSILPEEYGGTAGPLKQLADAWYKRVISQRDFFIEEEQKRLFESRAKVAGNIPSK